MVTACKKTINETSSMLFMLIRGRLLICWALLCPTRIKAGFVVDVWFTREQTQGHSLGCHLAGVPAHHQTHILPPDYDSRIKASIKGLLVVPGIKRAQYWHFIHFHFIPCQYLLYPPLAVSKSLVILPELPGKHSLNNRMPPTAKKRRSGIQERPEQRSVRNKLYLTLISLSLILAILGSFLWQ